MAHLRGLDPHEFFPITWARWMDCLELQTVNAVRVRLAKLEAMGLIEVLPGRRGPSGSSPYRFRVRWEGSEEKVSAVFAKTLDTHEREVARMRRAKGGDGQAPSTPFPEGASSSRRIPRDVRLDEHPPRFVQTNPPPVFVQTNPPSLKEELKKKEEKKKNPSVSPSVFCLKKDRTDGLTEMDGEGSFDCSSWLRDVDSKPWPERLLEGLQEILEPGQVLALEGRSPWSAEGAWAIFQAIRSQTRLKHPEGTLWNALLEVPKAEDWLAFAGPKLRTAGWRAEPADGTPAENAVRAFHRRDLERHGLSRLPLSREEMEEHRRLLAPARTPGDRVEVEEFWEETGDEEPWDPREERGTGSGNGKGFSGWAG